MGPTALIPMTQATLMKRRRPKKSSILSTLGKTPVHCSGEGEEIEDESEEDSDNEEIEIPPDPEHEPRMAALRQILRINYSPFVTICNTK